MGKEKVFDNKQRTRYYGLRIGDLVSPKVGNGEEWHKGKCKVVGYGGSDNNRVQIKVSDGSVVGWVAEHCVIVITVENQLGYSKSMDVALHWWNTLSMINLKDMDDSMAGYCRKYYPKETDCGSLTTEQILHIWEQEKGNKSSGTGVLEARSHFEDISIPSRGTGVEKTPRIKLGVGDDLNNIIELTREDLKEDRKNLLINKITLADFKYPNLDEEDIRKADIIIFVDGNLRRDLKNKHTGQLEKAVEDKKCFSIHEENAIWSIITTLAKEPKKIHHRKDVFKQLYEELNWLSDSPNIKIDKE